MAGSSARCVMTAAISLGVAALVLLPRLENSLKNASKKTLITAIEGSKSRDRQHRRDSLLGYPGSLRPRRSMEAAGQGGEGRHIQRDRARVTLSGRLGRDQYVTAVRRHRPAGQRRRRSIRIRARAATSPRWRPTATSRKAFQRQRQALYSFGHSRETGGAGRDLRCQRLTPYSLSGSRSRRSRTLSRRSANAFEIAALVAILLTILIAIPLAGTLVSRLQRLRQAALQLAIGGNVADFPADRARDEVGDLARSFSIMQRRLRQQEEARRAFVATASHELRTPLASLEGMLELLADDLQADQPDLEDAAALLDRSRVQSRRLGAAGCRPARSQSHRR